MKLDANAWRVLLIGLGTLGVPLDTAVNIAFPDITRAFGLEVAMIQWVVICYVLTYGSLMLALGRVGDLFGYALVFRLGLSWSFVAYILCATATSLEGLLFCRALQGVGAALVLSCGPALTTSLFPETARARILGVYAMMFAIGGALGPSLGGLLVERWGWPAVFWFRAPIVLLALALLRGVPARDQRRREPFDLLGAALFALALAAALLAVNRARLLSAGDYAALLIAPIAAALLAGFIRRELRYAQPIVNLRVFAALDFSLINLGNLLAQMASFAVLLLVPYALARMPALSVPLAGLLLACNPLGGVIASPLAGWLVGRVAPGRVALVGAVLVAFGLWQVSQWQAPSPPVIALTLALQGFGMGLFQVAYSDIVTSTLPRADRGVAGSLTMLTRTLGTVVAATVLTLVFQSVEAGHGFAAAFHTTFQVAAAVALAGALAALQPTVTTRR